tara:strand:+ start:2638 stop:3045 length:408 start_codon:yes stop_codon:yes gene_type:complete
MSQKNAHTHLSFHITLLKTFNQTVRQQAPFCGAEMTTDQQEFIDQLEALPQQLNGSADGVFNGQQLFCKIIASYPHLTPLIPRDLLWFLGGDCLHFMPDNEIHSYQQLDEARFNADHEQRLFDYKEERAKVFGMH